MEISRGCGVNNRGLQLRLNHVQHLRTRSPRTATTRKEDDSVYSTTSAETIAQPILDVCEYDTNIDI